MLTGPVFERSVSIVGVQSPVRGGLGGCVDPVGRGPTSYEGRVSKEPRPVPSREVSSDMTP